MPGSIWWCTPPGSDSQREPRSCSPSKQASARHAARECVTQRILQADTWGVGPRQIADYALLRAALGHQRDDSQISLFWLSREGRTALQVRAMEGGSQV
jgi:hypothetical protein